MEQYKLPSHNNSDKVFIVNRSELEGRIDPYFFKKEFDVISDKLSHIETLPLKKVSVKIFSGITPLSGGDSYTDRENGIAFIRSGDYSEDNIIDFSSTNYITTSVHNGIMSSSKIKKGDLLIAIVGATIGKVGIYNYDEEANINQAICAIRLKEQFIPEFIHIYLLTALGQKILDRLKRPVARANINLEEISSIQIPQITRTRQKEVVDFYYNKIDLKQQKEAEAKALLDSIDNYLLGELGITLPEKDDSLQKRVFTAQFSEIGGGRLDPLSLKNNISDFLTGKYKEKKIKEIALNFKSGFGAGKQDQVLDDSGIIQIRPTNIDEQGTLKFDKNVYLPVDNSYNGSDFINVDDILFNNTNSQEWVGKTAILKEQQQLLFSNHITKIVVNKEVAVPDYIWLILNSYQKNKIFYSICTNWNNQSGVGLDLLRSLPIPIPPLEKQNEIAQHIQSLREQAKQLQNDAKAILEQAKKDVEQMILG
ncbi:restriction endonuclease subunit S [Dysgonomonas macrotermitis]|uniref:Type I restriction enzyme, S subunit n=1 Tax=Dysgonomonas macrotermitis TaxID=1346286 RepID=A0A1M4XXS3_9BACT|nr:restriction endonuclease subunit S [Dysgonomonas macrotermitis]SHE98052.1 type I restriction enzyme, S subunit [Dysgonomonas macrotermitis]